MYITFRLRRLCGWLTGIVFLMSGILKVMDPVGTSLIIKEYLNFLHLGFLSGAAMPMAVALALLETLTGVMLVSGVFRRIAGIITFALISFFTIITAILVIFNPVMDCGCFGEAIHLTHWQSLIKNLIILALCCICFVPLRHLGIPKKQKYVSATITTLSILAFAAYSIAYIPAMDFTDFKAGTTTAAGEDAWQRKVVEEEAEDEENIEIIFVYEKDSKKEEFTLENLPDSTWTFVETKTVSLKPVKTAPILSFRDTLGTYCDHIAAVGPTMTISVYEFDKVKKEKWTQIANFLSHSKEADFTPLLLVAQTQDAVQKAYSSLDPETAQILTEHTYYSDYKTLITLNRSNGGATYIHDGTIIEKWAFQTRPSEEGLKNINLDDEVERLIRHRSATSTKFQGFMLYIFAILLLL